MNHYGASYRFDPRPLDCQTKTRTLDGAHRPGPEGVCISFPRCSFRFKVWRVAISGEVPISGKMAEAEPGKKQ